MGLYAARGDDLVGNYAPLYDGYTDMAGTNAQALWNRVTQASASTGIPKVYAFLVVINNEYEIVTMHRPTLFRGHPVQVSPHDGRAFAFYGDKQANDEYVELVEFPRDAFTVRNNTVVYTIQETELRVTAHVDQDSGMLPGAAATDVNTEVVAVRYAIPVPYALIPEMLEYTMTPIRLWTTVVRPLLADPNTVANFGPFITWARAAVTMTQRPGHQDVVPRNCTNTFDRYFPPVRFTRPLNEFRRKVIQEDFPQYGADPNAC